MHDIKQQEAHVGLYRSPEYTKNFSFNLVFLANQSGHIVDKSVWKKH